MKDLKENIQKNNMKKLVLSVALSMFCYCTNNAMEKPIKIDDVLMTMLKGQINIFNAKKGIINQGKKIFNTINKTDGEKTKDKILNFIKNQFTEEQEQQDFQNTIKTLEQYFHLENISKDKINFKGLKLTELFWSDKGAKGEIEENDKPKIKNYFQAIIKAEKELSEAFKEYYEAKKAEKKDVENVENVEDVVIEGIMQECCGEGFSEQLDKKFSEKLENLYNTTKIEEKQEENKKEIIETIKKRITLKGKITKEDFISFLKQKIGEEKKETVPPVKIPSFHTKKEECPCCC